jgi:predicted HAD superfamily Cof-like phosphohydrolase
LKKEQDMVRAFHVAFDHPVANEPSRMPPERVQNRAKWLHEEIEEFKAAQTLEDQVDAMVDLIYFALGTMVELGVDSDKVFHIVHQANMRKLWSDGKPRFGDDGKVKKPAEWTDPRELVAQEIARQSANGQTPAD